MNILLIDDSAADVHLTKLALNETLSDSHIQVAEDGERALQYLNGAEQYSSVVHPDLILLDLNMPRFDGFSLLACIKALPQYRSTPVIILSTSDWPRDVERAYQLGALTYFTKPTSWKDYIALGSAIATVWNQWHAGFSWH